MAKYQKAISILRHMRNLLTTRAFEEDALEAAIHALNEVEEYRAIGTPEECRAAVERNNEKTRIIDGITECCGYDFGTDAFQMELSKFCPVCGREIERGAMKNETD